MSEGYRRAALALRAVPDADRDWVLGQLAAGQRQRLSAMLAEIDRLGFDVGAEDLARLLADGGEADSSRPSDAAASPAPAEGAAAEPAVAVPAASALTLTPVAAARERIGRAEAADLLPLLQGEPDAVLAALAGLADGPWHAALWQSRPDARAFDGTPTPAMADALLLALAARLDAAAEPALASPRAAPGAAARAATRGARPAASHGGRRP